MAPQLQDFYWSTDAEPHYLRRKKIKKDHPEVKALMGHDPRSAIFATATVAVQVLAAYLLRNVESWWVFFGVAYCLGGVVNQSITLAFHECSHNLMFGKGTYDRLFSIFVNLPLGLPAAATFRRYHLEHHLYQGVQGIDTDLPSGLEGKLVRGTFAKMIWMMLQGFFYAFRPLLVRPKLMTFWEAVNWAVQVSFDAAVVYYWGWKSLAYLIASSFLGMGIHPMAGHFIAEHYVSNPSTVQETYSYYGPLNLLTYNVGYHVEHHDFQNIPGSRLPRLREIAPEYYKDLKCYDSWVKVIWWYLTSDIASPYARVVRTKDTHDRGIARAGTM